MRFKDKSIIITGGGGKIGKAYALGFAKEGGKVALPDIASADHVVKAIRDMGGTAISMACDVSDEKSVKSMVDEVAKQFGRRRRAGQQCSVFYEREEKPVLGNGS